MTVRGSVTAAAAVAAFVAGFVTARGCASASDPVGVTPPAATSVRTDSAVRGETTSPEHRRPRRTNPSTNTPPVERDGAARATPDEAPPNDADFPFADVEVAWPNGDPADNAVVYALPAGAKCPEDDIPPNVNTDSKGRARLHVVARGRYDVGALLGVFQVLSTDVDLPGAGPLRLVMPEPCDVVVRMPDAGGPPSGKENDPIYRLHLVVAVDGERRPYPGRGETTGGWADGRIRDGPQDWRPAVPRGALCRIEHDAHFRVDPETFVAPANVRVSFELRYPIHLQLAMRTPERRFAEPRVLEVRFDRDELASWHWRWGELVPAGTDIGAVATRCGFDTEIDRPSGTLRWSGNGILAGELEFHDLPATPRTPLVAMIELDTGRDLPASAPRIPPPPAAPSNGPALRVESPGVKADDEVLVVAIDAAGESQCEYVSPGAVWRPAINARRAIALRGDFVSDLVDLPEPPAGETRLELARGGYLVAVPTTLPPNELGSARIERADGRPFFFEGGFHEACDLAVGATLGPFRPGTVEFKVTLAGRVLATATAEVRAGTYQTLRIPRLRTQ